MLLECKLHLHVSWAWFSLTKFDWRVIFRSDLQVINLAKGTQVLKSPEFVKFLVLFKFFECSYILVNYYCFVFYLKCITAKLTC